MALVKTPVAINFSQGLDLKTDVNQVKLGNFLALNNTVFTTAGQLTKRNGFVELTTLSSFKTVNYETLTTYNNNLIALGQNLYAYNPSVQTSNPALSWINRGSIQPVNIDTLPLVRNNTSQSSPDTAISNGLVCLVYVDSSIGACYQVLNSTTGEQIVGQTQFPATAVNPRAFVLGNYFVMTFMATVSASTHFQFIALPINNPANPTAAKNISTSVITLQGGHDGITNTDNNQLYVVWASASTTVNIAYITASLAVTPAVPATPAATIAGTAYAAMSVDYTNKIVYWTYSGSDNTFSAGYSYSLVSTMSPTLLTIGGADLGPVTSTVLNSNLIVFQQVKTFQAYDATVPWYQTKTSTVVPPVVSGNAGTPSAQAVVAGATSPASKAFTANSTAYLWVVYGNTSVSIGLTSNESTYFLVDVSGNVYAKLAYSNAGGYPASQVLGSITNISGEYSFPYLLNDFLATINKGTNLPVGTQINAIYTQTGVGLCSYSLSTQYSAEIAGTLNLTGGMLWEYDGVKPVENNFHVWPEYVEVTTSGSGGSITAGTYFYQFCYEWTNNQGRLERSAPSIPVSITTTGSTSTNTIHVPTLTLTYKTGTNPARIVGYRWSAAQQVYYQFTSLTTPTLNNPTLRAVTFTDTLADSSILGNNIIYTTGGVVEDIGAPASIGAALFDNRLWLIDAEDQNLLWYSKQVIENVPVEMSDLLTYYVAPTTSAQGSTGYLTGIYPMDDKLILFKQDAAYYVNGTGPDNTGSNSGYSQPIFITANVGCANPASIVLCPSGLMFQSDKGIWLLGRDLSTQYIGAAVEDYNSNAVMSATAIPGTTQIRFILNNNITLMYDYFYNQWATHSNILAISSTLYQGMHTYLNSLGQVYQESPNTFLDGSTPVLISFTTSWINIAGLQGYERFYFGNLLGTYYSPFILQGSMAYDYHPSPMQAVSITPQDYVPNYGGEQLWGSGQAWAGPGNVFTARFWPDKQKCQSFQVSMQEVYDPSLGQAAGQGLTLSGLSLIVGVKKGYRTQAAAKSFGS